MIKPLATMARRRWWIVLLLLALGPVVALAPATPAHAHGKEVEVDVACRASSPSSPLERRCEATVIFTADRDLVSDAQLVLRAARPDKAESGIEGVEFTSGDRPGQYAATFTLPAYGIWETTVRVLFPSEGEIHLDQDVLPPTGPLGADGAGQIRLVVGFESRDAANIVALVLHLLGAAGILAVNCAVLLGGLLIDERRTRYRQTVARLFPRVVGGSIVVLAVTGAYSARYNAPTRPPGLLAAGAVGGLPFGGAYLVVFATKMVFAVALVVGTFLLARRLRHDDRWLPSAIPDGAVTTPRAPASEARRIDRCAPLAAANLVVGGAVLVAAVVVDYLHLLTHAGGLPT